MTLGFVTALAGLVPRWGAAISITGTRFAPPPAGHPGGAPIGTVAMITVLLLEPYLGFVLREATIPELPGHYSGKVRDNYDLPDGRRIIIATDRLSAFDQILTAVPLKGQVL